MARVITIPVVLGGARHLWSENGVPNGIRYRYCAGHCLTEHVHCGHDVEAIYEPIFAATDGLVKYGGRDEFFTPNHVDIEPTVGPFKGEYHIYGHLSEAWVTTGQTVKRGQRIGTTGTNCTNSSCAVLAVGNEHLHFERRGVPGFKGCALDPDPVLTSLNANGAGADEFGRDDKIRVADGPVRLRQGPGLNFAILQDLPTGAELCVTGDLLPADGFGWSPVLVSNINQAGWVAGQVCTLVAAEGCTASPIGTPGAVPVGAAHPGQPIGAHPDTAPTSKDMARLAEQMPVAEYDKDGIFVGVTIPSPAPAVGAPGDGVAEITPWANG